MIVNVISIILILILCVVCLYFFIKIEDLTEELYKLKMSKESGSRILDVRLNKIESLALDALNRSGINSKSINLIKKEMK